MGDMSPTKVSKGVYGVCDDDGFLTDDGRKRACGVCSGRMKSANIKNVNTEFFDAYSPGRSGKDCR